MFYESPGTQYFEYQGVEEVAYVFGGGAGDQHVLIQSSKVPARC